VNVEPTEPWQASAQKQSSIFVLNTVGLGFALASSISVSFVIFMKFTKSKPQNKFKTSYEDGPELQPSGPLTSSSSSKLDFKFEGVKGKVLEAYVKASKSVEWATGTSLKLEMTLREFLIESEPKLGKVALQFGQLTTLAEISLYSPHAPKESDAANAEKLLNEIERALGK